MIRNAFILSRIISLLLENIKSNVFIVSIPFSQYKQSICVVSKTHATQCLSFSL